MPWHRLRISSAQAAGGRHIDIQNRFIEAFIALGSPPDMAMFSGSIANDLLSVYFSPATDQALLRSIAAEPCDRPDDIAGLAVGASDALDRLAGLVTGRESF